MRNSLIITTSLLALLGCGGQSGGTVPGALVDNLDWVPTDAGTEFFGEPPEDGVCPLTPEGDCPVPDGECVTFPPGSNCVVSFIPECLDQFTVLSVYTRRPNNTPLCNWITLEQPSLKAIRAGDEVEIRVFHWPLNSPVGGEARIALSVGDELAFEQLIPIPQVFQFYTGRWTATRDIPKGTTVLFHVDNHGTNEYGLVEVNVCEPRPPGGDGEPLPCLP